MSLQECQRHQAESESLKHEVNEVKVSGFIFLSYFVSLQIIKTFLILLLLLVSVLCIVKCLLFTSALFRT